VFVPRGRAKLFFFLKIGGQNAQKKGWELFKIKKIYKKSKLFFKRVFTNCILYGKLWEINFAKYTNIEVNSGKNWYY
jgi:hypothetical protein